MEAQQQTTLLDISDEDDGRLEAIGLRTIRHCIGAARTGRARHRGSPRLLGMAVFTLRMRVPRAPWTKDRDIERPEHQPTGPRSRTL
jgi:hypothetical protein